MENEKLKNIVLVSASASHKLAKAVAKELGIKLFPLKFDRFTDGEFLPQFIESIRGKIVIIFQSLYPKPIVGYKHLNEVLWIADAAMRASAKEVVIVAPYFPGRQDRKDRPRVSITAKAIANQIVAAGIKRMITMDLHADQIQGFFDIPVDHVHASYLFLPLIKQLNLPNLALASADAGGSKRVFFYAKKLKCNDLIICQKIRGEHETVDRILMAGDPKGKNVLLIDDLISTAGTILKVTDELFARGALSVTVIATHPMLTNGAKKKLEASRITTVYMTDSIPLKEKSSKIIVLSCAKMLAKVINRLNNNESITDLFI